eukprot:scaffold20249_cov63-Phaeocystis_antarctica.AAC.1
MSACEQMSARVRCSCGRPGIALREVWKPWSKWCEAMPERDGVRDGSAVCGERAWSAGRRGEANNQPNQTNILGKDTNCYTRTNSPKASWAGACSSAGAMPGNLRSRSPITVGSSRTLPSPREMKELTDYGRSWAFHSPGEMKTP